METITLKIEDMMCAHCAKRIENALKPITGIKNINIDVNSKTVKIQGEAKPTDIMAAITAAGYHPTLL